MQLHMTSLKEQGLDRLWLLWEALLLLPFLESVL